MNQKIVLKFGGSSLSDKTGIDRVVNIVLEKKSLFENVVVVVSAMGNTTDKLLTKATPYSPDKSLRELDMLLTSGERVSASILSMALNSKGVKAISFTGSQAGIITDDNHTNARIIEIRPHRLITALNDGNIVVVGGFQGVSFKKEVTTLGRGGSDTSAVALASALDAERCEIYSDVDGVYSTDPRIVNAPKKADILSYEEMQEMAEAGAGVLHPKAVEFAKIKKTPIVCKSSFDPERDGTIIKNLEGRIRPKVVGIASEERISFIRVSGKMVYQVIELCERENLKVKQISFYRDTEGEMKGSLIIPEKENYHLDHAVTRIHSTFGEEIKIDRSLSAISLIGAGITDKNDFLLNSINLLKEASVSYYSVHTSSFRISLLINRSDLHKAINLFYDEFIGLEDRKISY